MFLFSDNKQREDLYKLFYLITFFIIAIFLTNYYQAEIEHYLDFGYWGMLVYVLLAITSTVLAPINTLPLIPVATALWGGLTSALLSILAWTIGSVIAFLIARNFGKPLLEKYQDLENINRYEKLLGTKYIFWNIVTLRILIPVDILSYAIGLFTSIKLTTYTLATIIGVSPFAFILAYSSTLPPSLQIMVGLIFLSALYLGYKKVKSIT